MINSIPWLNPIETKSALDEKNTKTKISIIKWVAHIPSIPKENLFIINWKKDIDEFQYPSLHELRMQFEEAGIYSKKRVDEIMKVYERLPKYKAQRNSVARGTKRG